jgi:hypothetical protein
MEDEQTRARRQREQQAIIEAKKSGRAFTYVDDDGCEVTVTPQGHAFYNAADWY